MATVVTLASARALLRRRRVERGTLALLFVLVAVTSFVVAASPRLFDQVADRGLRYEVATGTPTRRNIQFTSIGRIPGQQGDPFARIRARGEGLEAELPGPVRELVGARTFIVDTTRFAVVDPPNYATMVTLSYQDGITDLVDFVEGRPPARLERAVAEPSDPAAAPLRFEVAMSSATAAEIKVGVGDVLRATIDPSDPLLRRVFPRPTTGIEIAVVGLFEVPDPDDPAWYGESRMRRAAIGGSDERPIAFTTALMAPEAYLDLGELSVPSQYRWRFLTDVDRFDTGRLETLVPALRRLDTTYGSTTGTPGDLVYRSGLLDIVERFAQRRATTEATLSVAAMGPLVVAAGALGLIAAIIVRRRRTSILLARGRGASARQLLLAQVWEGLLVSVPATLVGLGLAVVVIDARWNPMSAAASGLVAVAATAILVGATWPLARRARREIERAETVARRPSARRLVLEATAVVVALTAAWLLRERSVTGAATVGPVSGFDPFLAAAPILVGVAVALLAIRAYPIPVRLLAAAAARRRDLVPVLGLRSIGRHPGAAYLPLLVLTLTVGIGVFSAVVATTIDHGQLAASWREVGADFRVDAPVGGALDPAIDRDGIPGAIAQAKAFSLAVQPAVGTQPGSTTTQLLALDIAAYDEVLAAAPVGPGAARGLPVPEDTGIGREDTPIPAIVSARAPNGWSPRAVGDRFALAVRGQNLWFVVDGVADQFPGIAPASTFVVAPLASVTAAHDASTLRATTLFVRGDPSVGDALGERIAAAEANATLTSRHAVFAAVHDAPLVGAVGAGFAIALAVAAAYAALAVVAMIALDAQRRARELAFLRTLGLSERQMVGLTVVEHAPPVVLAIAIGVALGLGVAWLLAPGLALDVFIVAGAPVSLAVDWPTVAAVITAIVAVVALAIGVSSWLARRLAPAQALRMGEG